jgi:PAS domain-containing protein
MDLYSVLLEMMVLLGVWLGLAVWHEDRNTPGRRTFILATLAWGLWCFGELARIRGMLPQPAAILVSHTGSLMLAPLWLGVAAQTARLEIVRRVSWLPVPLLAPAFCVIALLFSDRWRGLYLSTGEHGAGVHGPLWPIMLVYGFGLALAGCAILMMASIRWRQAGEAGRRFAIGVAPLITVSGSALYFGGVWAAPVDPTPLLLGVTLLVLHRGIFAGGLLRPLAISRHALVQQLPLGIVLTDRGGVVVDVNRVAERRLGMSASAAIGRNLDAVIDAADADLRFEITPAIAAGAEAGQIVLLDPPRKEEPTAESGDVVGPSPPADSLS